MNQLETVTARSQANSNRVQFRMHPRVFAALGADLVTSDVVAVIELVKNSYDAYAQNVHLRFIETEQEGRYLEITDDGCGMTKDIIENVWCVIATPYKEEYPVVSNITNQRRVSGEKGLGRLSAARLGQRLRMLTKAAGNICWEVTVNWTSISEGNDLSNSFIICTPYSGDEIFKSSGTRIQIFGLAELWSDQQFADLEDNLARLISPFSIVKDFRIFFSRFDDGEENMVEIESPAFLSKPKYSIKGSTNAVGNVTAHYKFAPITNAKPRKSKQMLSWSKIFDGIRNKERFPLDSQGTDCGKFKFEIRAWDIATEDTSEIAEHFKLQKTQIRKSIKAYKGISVYRDEVLVLPKSENARDWLGLDLRRVSKVGTRLGTSQIVGYVLITAKHNPKIQDTSDRERLVSRKEVAEFEEILKAVVGLLENERDKDRSRHDDPRPMEDLFQDFDASDLLDKVNELVENDKPTKFVIPLIRHHKRVLESTRTVLQKRFTYYSRLATVGTIAHMLIHEIRNRTITFGAFLSAVKDKFSPFGDNKLDAKYERADRSVDALEHLAETFSPLASVSFRKRKRKSILEEQIGFCLSLHQGDINKKGIKCSTPTTKTCVAVDPGELDTILLNLITNAVYWLDDMPQEMRELAFTIESLDTLERVKVIVRDTGPGINEDDMDMIFRPGVTRKPDGIGMGLTVAAELVHLHGGRMAIELHEGTKGANFTFDLPLVV